MEPPLTQANTLTVEVIVDDGIEPFATDDMMIAAAVRAAAFRGFDRGGIGIRLTDDVTIREINKTHLGHDYATDVISFAYSAVDHQVSGELVASVETASRMSRGDWSPAAELVLYIVHGTLHITGMDDHDPDDRLAMRDAERVIMTKLGFADIHRFGADQCDGDDEDSAP